MKKEQKSTKDKCKKCFRHINKADELRPTFKKGIEKAQINNIRDKKVIVQVALQRHKGP